MMRRRMVRAAFGRCSRPLAMAWIFALLATGSVAAAIETLNVTDALAATKARLDAGQQANVVIFGDSLSFEGFAWASWVPAFRNLMQQHYGDAGYGYQSFSSLTGGAAMSGGQFIGSGPNVDLHPWRALDGQWVGLASPGTAVDFTAYGHSVELHYHVGPGGGLAEVRDSTGTLLATLDAYAAQTGAAAWTHTFDHDDRMVRIESISGSTFSILGYNNLADDPLAAGVRIHRASNSGWNTTNYVRRDASFDDQLAMLDVDLVMIMLGQNEWSGGGPAFESRLASIVNRVQAAGADVLLLGSYNSNRSYLPSVMNSQQRVAEAMGVGFINLHATAGSFAHWLSSGYLHNDNLHFSPAGGDYLAQFLFEAFLSDGRSVYPWLPGDMNGDGVVDAADIDPWVLALVDPEAYDAQYATVWAQRSGDFNGDGRITTADITPFIALLNNSGGGAVIPEPASVTLLTLGALVLARRQRI
jgi:hypothetical protein